MSPDFLPALFSNLWSIFLVILFFGGSIFVHELGHFLAARRRGVHVERFAIGFGPAIFSWRGRDGVEYRIGCIPFGGYVLLPQLADLGAIEGTSRVDASKLPPISYATRMLVFVAGAAFNILFAITLATIIWFVGKPTLSVLATTRIGTVAPTVTRADGKVVPNPAAEAGLKPGDVVKSVDGQRVNSFDDIFNAVVLGSRRTAEGRREAIFAIQREGREMTITVHPELVGEEQIRVAGVEPAEDLTADEVLPGSPAEIAGVRPGDRIVAVDGELLFQRAAVTEYLTRHSDRPNNFVFERDGQRITLPIQPRLEADERTGKTVARIGLRYREHVIIVHPTPWEQISNHLNNTLRTLAALTNPSSDIGPSKLSGPIGIARALHQQAQWDTRAVISLAILVNISLAIFNLLPFPILDGGQMLLATINRFSRRPLPVNLVVAMQSAFLVILLSLAVYVTFFDARRWKRDLQSDRAEAAAVEKTKVAPSPATP